ncbi:GNAT family N-acetyltransferase [Halobacillus litoralis]|uniref:GNAT family N-acetyltransferase n=1 Tax=Halobacillus litoralis TaxID=45668 RepID=UPI001CD55088|nr:GNAT family N-acetyltransferase [Halobacillus litoralis]MCA0970207.1 GNAT family N-acetyltransferase [Halobacillus litoralis]
MKIRKVRFEQDQDKLLSFRRDAELESYGHMERFDETSYLKRIRSRIDNKSGGQVFIVEDGFPIGQIGCEIRGNLGYVNIFYLVPSYRGKGYGKKLIRWAEDYFREHELNTYQLKVAKRNIRAVSLYEKEGLVPVKKEEECYIMEKDIKNPSD